MRLAAINLADKFGKFSEQWAPKVIAEPNDYQFKIVRIEGELRIDFHDGHVVIKPGEMFVVPRGLQHKPSAAREVKMMLIEPRGILNTGHEDGARTALNDVWI